LLQRFGEGGKLEPQMLKKNQSTSISTRTIGETKEPFPVTPKIPEIPDV
jgi:hypothetical protein